MPVFRSAASLLIFISFYSIQIKEIQNTNMNITRVFLMILSLCMLSLVNSEAYFVEFKFKPNAGTDMTSFEDDLKTFLLSKGLIASQIKQITAILVE